MKKWFAAVCLIGLIGFAGCAPVLIGGGAAAGYKAGTDERKIGRMWDDATISTRIKTRMIEDSVVKARKIDVDTIAGNVILTGVVDTRAEIERALEIARGVPGVKSVKSNLAVGGKTIGQNVDDRVLLSKIKSKLVAEPGIRSLNIDVDVVRGVVTLSGIVKTQGQRDAVIRIARNTAGTVRVVDLITVRYP